MTETGSDEFKAGRDPSEEDLVKGFLGKFIFPVEGIFVSCLAGIIDDDGDDDDDGDGFALINNSSQKKNLRKNRSDQIRSKQQKSKIRIDNTPFHR